ncbi:hypothetical protein MGWOODY_Smn1173 [hydrothermal vent metagenome]|uniref:Uncharacterized protein n=1 Tax=hydrothermal vent metagenome TaxID=652676 RepID=A0A160TMB5_9ZZZZ
MGFRVAAREIAISVSMARSRNERPASRKPHCQNGNGEYKFAQCSNEA